MNKVTLSFSLPFLPSLSLSLSNFRLLLWNHFLGRRKALIGVVDEAPIFTRLLRKILFLSACMHITLSVGSSTPFPVCLCEKQRLVSKRMLHMKSTLTNLSARLPASLSLSIVNEIQFVTCASIFSLLLSLSLTGTDTFFRLLIIMHRSTGTLDTSMDSTNRQQWKNASRQIEFCSGWESQMTLLLPLLSGWRMLVPLPCSHCSPHASVHLCLCLVNLTNTWDTGEMNALSNLIHWLLQPSLSKIHIPYALLVNDNDRFIINGEDKSAFPLSFFFSLSLRYLFLLLASSPLVIPNASTV